MLLSRRRIQLHLIEMLNIQVITNILAQYIVLNELNWKIICMEHSFELTRYLATVFLILHTKDS